jgi:autotransporter-associated beta strand protein
MLRTTAQAGGVIAVLLVFWSAPARAQDATWLASPATAIYNEGANWTGGSVPTGTATFEASNQRNLTVNGSTIGGWVFNAGAGEYTFTNNLNVVFNGSGIQVNSGSGATIINNNTLQFYNNSSAGSATITNNVGLFFIDTSSAGSATITNKSTVGFSGTSSAGSATITNNSSLSFTNTSSAGSATITNGNFLRFLLTSSAGSATITTSSGAALNGTGTLFVGSAAGGTSRHIVNSGGLLDITGLSAAGLTIGSLEGSGLVAIGGKTLTIGANNLSTTFSGVIQNQGHQPGSGALAGSLVKTGTGTLILSGTDTYTGTTTVDGGVLSVNGSIASSSSLIVNSGGTIGGNGTLPTTIVNGVIAPGNSIGTLTINGNLTLNAGSVTQIEVQGATSDKFIVTGSATLGGTLQLIALGSGPFVFGTPTTIITAAGGASGSFASVNTNAAFGVGVTSTVTYSANAVQITLWPGSLIQAFAITRPENVIAVATGIDRAVAAGGNASPFFAVYNQPTQVALTSALNTLSGEVHTSANALGLQASDQFMRVMLDRTNTGRSGGLRPGQPAGYDINVWGAAFGQTGRMPGEAATIGSSRRNASDWNIAFGADMRVHPTTIVGIAAAGGQGTATVTGGLGAAKADIFQFGAYSMSRFGALSINLAGSFATLDVETDRTIPVLGAASVKGSYRAHAWSGRAEAAYGTFTLSGITLSPYAAIQGTSTRSPSFVEKVNGGVAPFSVVATGTGNGTVRTEAGLHFDLITMGPSSQMNVYARAAWAHYLSNGSSFTGLLAGLPGSGFKVTGARAASNSALIGLGADVKLGQSMTLGGTFNTEISPRQQSYSGSVKLNVAF